MMFSKEDIESSNLSSKIEYLENKHRGGTNSKDGNRYEDHFAVYKIVELSTFHFSNASSVIFYDQVPYAFVDDLLIEVEGTHNFYQLKSNQTLTWNRNLTCDFENQFDFCTEKKLRFTLNLVVKSDSLQEKLIPMPSKAYKKSYIWNFPKPHRIEDLWEESTFYNNVKTIIGKSEPLPSHIEALTKGFLSAWLTASSDTGVSLDSLMKSANEIFPTRTDWTPPNKWNKLETILEKINGLRVSIQRGYFEWDFGPGIDSGSFQKPCFSQEFERFMDRVITKAPTDYSELMTELYLL